ncbi:hypothetical protein [Pseudomonas sp. AAC]|uniref:hypothetical protein n=1 Tax=Pseudomonas sp. AAC TaxID=1502784 RepID=UPI0004D42C60|nr:hypothetical protein [Pseudomonas sp. AAC]KES21638.1 hypothetical protein FG99_23475 [Pseudomonas sp. AAC]
MNIHPLGHESARLMSEAGYAVDVISKLILEDQCRKSDRDREGYLSDYDLGGLLAALTVAGQSLQECGERFSEFLQHSEQSETAATATIEGRAKESAQ